MSSMRVAGSLVLVDCTRLLLVRRVMHRGDGDLTCLTDADYVEIVPIIVLRSSEQLA
jgi:hypothetical protein